TWPRVAETRPPIHASNELEAVMRFRAALLGVLALLSVAAPFAAAPNPAPHSVPPYNTQSPQPLAVLPRPSPLTPDFPAAPPPPSSPHSDRARRPPSAARRQSPGALSPHPELAGAFAAAPKFTAGNSAQSKSPRAVAGHSADAFRSVADGNSPDAPVMMSWAI